jgi:hypothetical protein
MTAQQNNPEANEELILKNCVALLSEHYDAVEILVTRFEDGTTKAHSKGAGNWYTRYGLAREYIERADEQMRIEKRNQHDD